MSTLELPAVREQDFEASGTYDGTCLHLTLRGSAELRVSELLGPFLARVHEEALRLGVGEVSADLTQLQFMSSSCFKRFVTWLNVLRELEGRVPYGVRFLSNPRLRWQKSSLAALSCFAPGPVTVESVETP